MVFNTKKESLSNIEVVNENIDATQSILTVGMKINNCNADDFYALNLYNLILGGAPSSKLFQTVREKESLAYDISSIYNCFKDIISIYAGINKDNYLKVIKYTYSNPKTFNSIMQLFDKEKQEWLKNLLSSKSKDENSRDIDCMYLIPYIFSMKNTDYIKQAIGLLYEILEGDSSKIYRKSANLINLLQKEKPGIEWEVRKKNRER